MAINWSAYDAAKEIIEGKNVANIQDIGSRFPLFSRLVMAAGAGALPILAALKDYTARKFEMNMKAIIEDADDSEEVAEEKAEKPEKKASAKKGRKKAEPVEEEPDEDEETFEGDAVDYESMTGKELYGLCCKRGLSSQCKKRDKNSLIAVLKSADGENTSADDEDWDDDEEEEVDPYEGKKAKDLYLMCKKRGIKCKTGMAADAYVKLLKKADAEEAEADEEDDDDEWEV